MTIAVGSTNPIKINCVKLAFSAVWPEKTIHVEGIEVDSGVSSQPLSDEECITGATNRATQAIKVLKADFGVGLEGGIHKIGEDWFDCGWIVVMDKKGTIGVGSTIRMHLPLRAQKMILEENMELGEVSDILFNTKNSKQDMGQFGLMTNNALTRTSAYKDGVISALARFLHPEVYT